MISYDLTVKILVDLRSVECWRNFIPAMLLRIFFLPLLFC